jgi:hypothetical protein
MISGFVQTDEIQECQFGLVVSDGEYDSFPDTVNVIIVPTLTESTMVLENESFDPQKPTIIFFDGYRSSRWSKPTTGGGEWRNRANKVASNFSAWEQRANIISFYPYVADDASSDRDTATYYRCADMIIVYLSAVAPDYDEYIQTMGYSLGGMPAIDVARFLNETYGDRRYAINRVTLFDTTVYLDYSHRIRDGLIERIDGEQCWIENYVCTMGWGRAPFYDNIFNVAFDKFNVTPYESGKHGNAVKWYGNSIADPNINLFNNGVVAGVYWSVIGPGKNLQLASTPGVETYKFTWYGDIFSGHMDFYNEAKHPGRLPEPVTLVGPPDGALAEVSGVVLSCEVSENAVGYRLLLGQDPYHMEYLVSDTPNPPTEPITTFPCQQTWWTIKVYDQSGSTIYADPACIYAENIQSQAIENLTNTKQYSSIQQAINDASDGDEIVISPGIYQYLENIDFKGKNITVRSTDPNDSAVVTATVINGGHRGPVVTVSGTQETDCLLAGLTILGGTVGVSCHGGYLTIRNCTIESNGPSAVEFWEGYEPRIIDCAIVGYVHDRRLLAHWTLDETEGTTAHDSAGIHDGTLNGDPQWEPVNGNVDGALQFDGTDDYVSTTSVLDPAVVLFSVFAWIKGGAPGQVVISQTGGENWLLADPSEGKLMTMLLAPGGGRFAPQPLISEIIITDGNWHRVGFVWDSSDRILYIDDVEVARDTQIGLVSSEGGLYLGAGKDLEPGSFFSGLIDDVRIYNRAVTP